MTIKSVKGGYALFSKTTGRRLSKVYKSKNSPALLKREKQVRAFKNNAQYKKEHGGKGFLKRTKKK